MIHMTKVASVKAIMRSTTDRAESELIPKWLKMP